MLLAACLLSGIGQPAPYHKAGYARWMVSTLSYGSLSTTSTRSNGSHVGDAFGNTNSFADVKGTPYLYVSNLDASMIDLFTAPSAKPRGSLALSAASLLAPNGTSIIQDCEIGVGFGDPENPPCARLTLSGDFSKVPANSTEHAAAYAALLERHPFIKTLPDDHDFFVAKLSLDGIWLIDDYGGAAIVDPTDYFAASAPAPAATIDMNPARNFIGARAITGKPPFTKKAETARWMVTELTYGFLATTSTRKNGSTPGDAFGNPYGIADVGGIPYFYGTDMDASFTDLFASAHSSIRCSLALSEAQLGGAQLSQACQIAPGQSGDPENPPCARLVISGGMAKVAANTTEEAKAKAALFKKHPSFENFPTGHGFYVARLDIDGLWLINFFGGAAIINPEDYFRAAIA
jgi:hypothetical protein